MEFTKEAQKAFGINERRATRLEKDLRRFYGNSDAAISIKASKPIKGIEMCKEPHKAYTATFIINDLQVSVFLIITKDKRKIIKII